MNMHAMQEIDCTQRDCNSGRYAALNHGVSPEVSVCEAHLVVGDSGCRRRDSYTSKDQLTPTMRMQSRLISGLLGAPLRDKHEIQVLAKLGFCQ